ISSPVGGIAPALATTLRGRPDVQPTTRWLETPKLTNYPPARKLPPYPQLHVSLAGLMPIPAFHKQALRSQADQNPLPLTAEEAVRNGDRPPPVLFPPGTAIHESCEPCRGH